MSKEENFDIAEDDEIMLQKMSQHDLTHTYTHEKKRTNKQQH